MFLKLSEKKIIRVIFSIYLLFLISASNQYIVKAADTLTINKKIGDTAKFSILQYNFPWPIYGMKPPWRSAMAQAQALNVLVRAHEITADNKYIHTAKMLLNSFFVEVKNGGVTYKTPKDGWWYELYAGDNASQPRVLNGMMYTLVALEDYYNHTRDKDSKFLFDQGIIALKKNLPLYDTNGSSGTDFYYDIMKTPNKFEYHIAVIHLLAQLYEITHEELLKAYHDKWSTFNPTELVHQVPPNIYLDNSSIPLVDYGTLDGIRIGLQRNPITVDHVALDYYNHYRKYDDKDSLSGFLNNADWLVRNAVPKS